MMSIQLPALCAAAAMALIVAAQAQTKAPATASAVASDIMIMQVAPCTTGSGNCLAVTSDMPVTSAPLAKCA